MMKTLNRLVTAFLLSLPATVYAQDPAQVFIYSPGEKDGLHIARLTDGGWQEMGQLCASDYGAWGAEKRMYHPSVARASDGSWRLVFQVNDKSPLFAAAYSKDLVNWRPQDYPLVSTRQCRQPVVRAEADGTFSIHYLSEQGRRVVKASADFRHFSADKADGMGPASLGERDTATVGGKLQQGSLFELYPAELTAITTHFDRLREDARLSGERLHHDPVPASTASAQATLTVTAAEKPISDKLIGIFFEDISYAADGGLYAELIQNRDFEYTPRDHKGWEATTAWHSARPIEVSTAQPLSANNPHYAILASRDTLWNEGWDGIPVEQGKRYDFSMYVQGLGTRQQFSVLLVGHDGSVLASAKVKGAASGWHQHATVLTARATDARARLAIVPQRAARVGIDMVSLFPQETFMNRKNGLRKDLAETIAALKPKFVRFPGGCMSHGQGLDNIYHWHETIGPLYDRKPDMNIWHYHQTRGLGFYEYFQFCEDIGAEPLPVLAAGVPCQNSANNAQGIGGQQGGIPMADMPAYIQELLDLIEWANGDPATSEWARMRAEAGHPAPFNLKYLGIGNEDIISTVFEERYEMIARAVREKYPDIKVCGTVGPFHTPSADYLEGWDFTRSHPDLQYMVDEHYYESTGWFLHHRDYYDGYDRQGTKVYLGEWAASTDEKRPNLETALAEALYLTDVERNGDIVEMTSYAPMLCKDGHANWNPDMIYFSNTEVRTTPAYDIQRLFSTHSGDRYVKTVLSGLSGHAGNAGDTDGSYRIGASLVRDTATGRRHLKLINALPVPLTLTLDGLTIPEGTEATGFEGQPRDRHLDIRTTTVGGHVIQLPPYSLRIIGL